MNFYPLGRVPVTEDRLVYWHFATPILRQKIDYADVAFNAKLEAIVAARRALLPESQVRTNHGGWQSSRDFFAWPEAPIERLRATVIEAIERITAHVQQPDMPLSEYAFETESWANVSPAGGFHTLHAHPGFSFSGVYYVSDGAPKTASAGRLEFADPRSNTYLPGVEQFSVAGLSFAAEPGMLIIFPAWLQHNVTPHDGSSNRISIAFNVRLKKREEVVK
jgi:uncharacterized protein (TIGR02466 family)